MILNFRNFYKLASLSKQTIEQKRNNKLRILKEDQIGTRSNVSV